MYNQSMQKTYVVVLAYFQNINLTQTDKDYLYSLKPENGEMLAILDVKRGACTAEQPLRPNQRQDILRGHKRLFNAGVAEHVHIKDNERWSLILDETIERNMPKGTMHIVLYAAKSLAQKYCGKYTVEEMEDIPGLTDVSAPVTVKPHTSNDFRQGIMYAEQRSFPMVYSTVDIALVDPTITYVLLGRKKDEKLWRFPGGFVDPTDASKEAAWCRELSEEVPSGVESYVSDIEYVCSNIVPDCRYPGRDKIMTTMFAAVVTFNVNELKAGDDLAEVQLFKISDDLFQTMTDDHHPALKSFLEWSSKTQVKLKGITY
jgi:bifunctional NMN adenylyltransferase/nudix hydrolase